MKISLPLIGKSVFASSCVLLAYAIYQGLLVPAYNSKTANVGLLSLISLAMLILGTWMIGKNRIPQRR